jgi:hypothetical protein
MQNLRDVSIERVVAHVLDCREVARKEEEDKTVFSDAPIDLENRLLLSKYFKDQIINVSQDESVGMAVLADEYKEELAPLYQKIISISDEFVPASKVLGERLYKIMLGDRRIAPGVLSVCVFRAANANYVPMLALLKLNIANTFVPHVGMDEKGRKVVTIQVIPDALPAAGERLQKAALIRKLENPGLEMLVLDRQVGDREMRPAADFFRRFLGAEWKFTPEVQMMRLFGILTEKAAEFYKSDDPQEWAVGDYIYQSLDVAFRSRRINLNVFVQDMGVQEDIKQNIRRELEEMQVPTVIDVNPDLAERLIGKVRYRGDHDLVMTASADIYDQLVREETIQEGGVSLKRICITTRRWQRLKPRKR